jgi:hypothetical protein
MDRKEILIKIKVYYDKYENWTVNKRSLYFAITYFNEGRDKQAILALNNVNFGTNTKVTNSDKYALITLIKSARPHPSLLVRFFFAYLSYDKNAK